MIKMLGGQVKAEPPAGAYPPSASYPPAHAPYPPPPYAPPPAGWAPPPSQEAWPAAAPPYAPPPGLAPDYPAPPGQPLMPPMAPMPGMAPAGAEDDEAKTQYMPGADIGKLKFPSSLFTLQLLDNAGQWRPWAPIGANGLNLGRSQGSAHFPFLSSMATRHVRFSYDGPQLRAEDLGSLNGVYLKITAPTELRDGTRFRVGSQVIEFRAAEPPDPVEPARSPDGEEFLSADVPCLAWLVLIRPDNEPGLRFPITRPEITRIGREGRVADIALPKAEWVSSQHAQIRAEGGRFLLEDLNSRNGTFVQLREPTPLRSGDVLLVGRAFLRVVDQSGA
jgi:pSer/pThr/pTyr-binding forkhead associated (FHA) protein